ncbi:hypothetical protein Egran_02721, partial [Elaphomyces granulatus]
SRRQLLLTSSRHSSCFLVTCSSQLKIFIDAGKMSVGVVAKRAMGQGEQRTLHPFFGQYGRNAAGTASQIASHQPSKLENDAGMKIIEQRNAVDLVDKRLVPLVEHITDSNDSISKRPATRKNGLSDGDSNSTRRKRRRTRLSTVPDSEQPDESFNLQDMIKPVGQENSLALSKIPESRGSSSENDAGFSKNSTAILTEQHLHYLDEQASSVVNPCSNPQSPAPNVLEPDEPEPVPANGTLSGLDLKKESSAKKILKLNPNGRLLSSPPLVGLEERGTGKAKNTRNSTSKARKPTGSRLVVIRYGIDGASKERIGRAIQSIVSDKHRHEAQHHATSVLDTKPPKPTHPFFLNKSLRPAEKPTSSQTKSCISATTDSYQAEEMKSPLASISEISNTVSHHRRNVVQHPKPYFARYSSPITPLWPPRDLVNVRDVEIKPCEPLRSGSALSEHKQRKGKGSIIRIGDLENVLLAKLRRTVLDVSPSCASQLELSALETLRMPTRDLSSGRVLQKGMLDQLSSSSAALCESSGEPRRFGGDGKRTSCHPAIAKLNSSLPSSMSAFDTGNYDSVQWTQKYAPTSAEEVLQAGPEALTLRDWLKNLMVSVVDTGRPGRDNQKLKHKRSNSRKRPKRCTRPEKLDGFIVSSGDEASEMDEVSDSDEDELAGDVTVPSRRSVVRAGDFKSILGSKCTGERDRMVNALLISGPSGCGKTASVYAAAKELDFEVFELNAGGRRSAKDIAERVGDMTQNHLVQTSDGDGVARSVSQDQDLTSAGQRKMNGFFNRITSDATKPYRQTKKVPNELAEATSVKASRNHKQSLILLEEADILFDEDKQFWTGVLALVSQSKRPIVITCNDESLIPLADLSLHAILRYRSPPHDLAVDYLLLLAANEGHMLKRDAINDLYSVTNQDIRKSIMELNFWCQIGVGSKNSGLDWMIDRWPRGADRDSHGGPLRVISMNTYASFMGWFSRDIIVDMDPLERETELLFEGLDWWQLGIQDMLQPAVSQCPEFTNTNSAALDLLFQEAQIADAKSDLDVLCTSWSLEHTKDILDTSISELPERQKANYVEGYPLLIADSRRDNTSLSASLGLTICVLLNNLSSGDCHSGGECAAAGRVLEKTARTHAPCFSRSEVLAAFEPITFENGTAVISEDLAPYIRAIVAFDLRLEKYRLDLSSILSQTRSRTRKIRKTRASRAALEGGDKASTRRERWFPKDTNSTQILATGGKEWQDVLVRSGHFCVPSVTRARSESSQSASESSGDGGF